ncbi:RICIN domain-containing protein [Nonomuraea sp. 3-1Str]|uniref:RICIN domain-containing protein n=1 Tax=Nonomuraea sp. 3-1Str TaxID=2929801 RepID=UPI002855397A|nr:RICIN domain-containing protein [Nonomuraea sp. 3-1Str]MDR8411525.1 RICIN domain-containing protein [Nonomuraea sp. 3-1Str]
MSTFPRRVLAFTAAAATALSLAAVPAAATAGSVATADASRLTNAATGMCLAVGRSEVRAGKKVIQWPCSDNKDQKWIYRHGRLTNAKTGMCLAIPHASPRKAEGVVQWPCTDGGAEQKWTYDGMQRLRNRATGMCLAVGKAERRKGKVVIQWPCGGQTDQVWLHR